MNFRLLQIALNHIKSTRNDVEFYMQVPNDTTELYQLPESKSEPDINKVNFRSNFSPFQTFNFLTFAKMHQINLWTSKSKSRNTPKSKITIRSYWNHQNTIPESSSQNSNFGQLFSLKLLKQESFFQINPESSEIRTRPHTSHNTQYETTRDLKPPNEMLILKTTGRIITYPKRIEFLLLKTRTG